MEEIIESTLSLLTVTHEQSLRTTGSEKALEPVYFLAMLDIEATWFKKWMVSNEKQKTIYLVVPCKLVAYRAAYFLSDLPFLIIKNQGLEIGKNT